MKIVVDDGPRRGKRLEDWWWSLAQLPQYALLSGYTSLPPHPRLGPLMIYSRTGFVVGAGEGGPRVWSPVERRFRVLWRVETSYRVPSGSRSLASHVNLEKLPVVLERVLNPRVYLLEPLAIRASVVRGRIEAFTGCVEAPGTAVAFWCRGSPCRLKPDNGNVVVDGHGVTLRLRRCGRGLIARLLNSMAPSESYVEVRGSVAVLKARGDEHSLELVVWNPHLHPVSIEVKVDARLVSGVACDALGCVELRTFADEALVSLGGETLATLRFELKPLPKLFARKRSG